MQIPETDLNLLVLKNALASDICVEMRIIGPSVGGIRGMSVGSPNPNLEPHIVLEQGTAR